MKTYPPGHEILYYAPATNLVGSQISHVCEFLWKFDDGEFKEGAVVSKIWNTLGMHKATCIVKNKENIIAQPKKEKFTLSKLFINNKYLNKTYNNKVKND